VREQSTAAGTFPQTSPAARADVGLRHSGRQVAAGAEPRVVCGAGFDTSRVLEVRYGYPARAHGDRAIAQLLDHCQDDPGVMIVGTDVVDTRPDKQRGTDREGCQRGCDNEPRSCNARHKIYSTMMVPTIFG
jgi:hypothetical protein